MEAVASTCNGEFKIPSLGEVQSRGNILFTFDEDDERLQL